VNALSKISNLVVTSSLTCYRSADVAYFPVDASEIDQSEIALTTHSTFPLRAESLVGQVKVSVGEE